MVRWGRQLSEVMIRNESFEGVILFALPDDLKKLPGRLTVPVVNVSSRNLFWKGSSVTPDNKAIGEMAATHYKERLFKHFAFVGVEVEPYSYTRYEGFARAVSPATCQTCWLNDSLPGGAEAANRALKEFLKTLPFGTGILTTNDIFARRVCAMAAEVHREIPADLAVLGVDADEMISLSSSVNLSSVDPDSEKIGFEAARLLHQHLSGNTTIEHLEIPPKGVVVAASTDHLATTDEDLARTLQFIKKHACQGITVEDVSQQIGIGRRTLERRFKEAVGKGIDEQIRKVRIDRAAELINKSDLTISEIAERSGFANLYYFSSAFKKYHGISPKQYRRNGLRI
jgi:LacI family transcriptional regulator